MPLIKRRSDATVDWELFVPSEVPIKLKVFSTYLGITVCLI